MGSAPPSSLARSWTLGLLVIAAVMLAVHLVPALAGLAAAAYVIAGLVAGLLLATTLAHRHNRTGADPPAVHAPLTTEAPMLVEASKSVEAPTPIEARTSVDSEQLANVLPIASVSPDSTETATEVIEESVVLAPAHTEAAVETIRIEPDATGNAVSDDTDDAEPNGADEPIPPVSDAAPMDAEPVELTLRFSADDSDPGESVMAIPLDERRFRLESTPIFGGDQIGLGDEIEAVPADDGVHRLVRLLARSPFRRWSGVVPTPLAATPAFQSLIHAIEAEGGRCERLFGGITILHLPQASTIDPEARIREIQQRLAR